MEKISLVATLIDPLDSLLPWSIRKAISKKTGITPGSRSHMAVTIDEIVNDRLNREIAELPLKRA